MEVAKVVHPLKIYDIKLVKRNHATKMFIWMFFLVLASLSPTKLLQVLDRIIILSLFIIHSVSLSIKNFIVAVIVIIAVITVVAAATFEVTALLGS